MLTTVWYIYHNKMWKIPDYVHDQDAGVNHENFGLMMSGVILWFNPGIIV